MMKQRLSLMDVLNPPLNPWLKEISQRNAKLPSGVRVVRLSGDEDDDQPDQSRPPRSGLPPLATSQAA